MKKIVLTFLIFFINFLNAGDNMDTLKKVENTFSSNINGVKLLIPLDLIIKKSNKNRYILEAEKSVINKIKIKEESNSLVIESKKGFKTEEKLNLFIEIMDIENIKLDGSIDAILKDLNENQLNIILAGAIDIEASASKTNSLYLESDGATDINFLKLKANDAKLKIEGTSDISVNVSQLLEIDSNGTVDINYKGKANIIKNISPNTDIHRID